MKSLIRLKVDEFCIENSITLDDLEKSENRERYIISIEDLFSSIDEINLDIEKNRLFLNGARIRLKNSDGIYRIYSEKKFIGLGIIKEGILKRDIVV